MKKKRLRFLPIVLLISILLFTGCKTDTPDISVEPQEPQLHITDTDINENPLENPDSQNLTLSEFNIDDIPEYSGEPYIVINDNVPFFQTDEITDVSFEDYPELDSLGRCQACTACLSLDTMPADGEERGEIGMIKPAGWHTVRYDDIISDKYLYNRCHLIGWQLGNENANVNNLTTGTRYLNVDGMLPFENQVADYIHDTGNHVMYRVTPIFVDNELVCRGILMEAQSVEDEGCVFCVYCYDVQPGITIDYTTGDSWVTGEEPEETAVITSEEHTYVLNTNSMKIHTPDCDSVNNMNPNNRQDYTGHIEDLEAQGYTRCGNCHPQ